MHIIDATTWRYAIAGAFNSVFGYLAFLLAHNGFGVDVFFSNIVAYGVGLSVAFFLNSSFVFRSSSGACRKAALFCIAFVASYLLNLGVLYLLVLGFDTSAEVAQIFAMLAYSVSFYLVNRYLIF